MNEQLISKWGKTGLLDDLVCSRDEENLCELLERVESQMKIERDEWEYVWSVSPPSFSLIPFKPVRIKIHKEILH